MIEDQTTVQNAETVLTYDVGRDERASEAVVAAVADASNRAPTDLDPLAEAIDPDALDALFADRYDGTPRTGGSTRFVFSDHEVVVTDGSLVTVRGPTR